MDIPIKSLLSIWEILTPFFSLIILMRSMFSGWEKKLDTINYSLGGRMYTSFRKSGRMSLRSGLMKGV